jgi:hypothetical protein
MRKRRHGESVVVHNKICEEEKESRRRSPPFSSARPQGNAMWINFKKKR